jgi:hypothetical protein
MNDGTDRFRAWMLSKAPARPYTEQELNTLLVLSRATHKHSAWLDHVIAAHYKAEYKRIWESESKEFRNWSGLN